jgi:hypothetical protein
LKSLNLPKSSPEKLYHFTAVKPTISRAAPTAAPISPMTPTVSRGAAP